MVLLGLLVLCASLTWLWHGGGPFHCWLINSPSHPHLELMSCRSTLVYFQEGLVGLEHGVNSVQLAQVFQVSPPLKTEIFLMLSQQKTHILPLNSQPCVFTTSLFLPELEGGGPPVNDAAIKKTLTPLAFGTFVQVASPARP